MYYLSCLAYYEFNINSIVEKYCVNKNKPELHCDGKCYLAKQLNKASNSDDNNSNKFLSVIHECFIPVYLSIYPEVKFNNFYTHSRNEKIFGYHNDYTFLSEFNNFKPPILKFNS